VLADNVLERRAAVPHFGFFEPQRRKIEAHTVQPRERVVIRALANIAATQNFFAQKIQAAGFERGGLDNQRLRWRRRSADLIGQIGNRGAEQAPDFAAAIERRFNKPSILAERANGSIGGNTLFASHAGQSLEARENFCGIILPHPGDNQGIVAAIAPGGMLHYLEELKRLQGKTPCLARD
jgi:hypothetical protein